MQCLTSLPSTRRSPNRDGQQTARQGQPPGTVTEDGSSEALREAERVLSTARKVADGRCSWTVPSLWCVSEQRLFKPFGQLETAVPAGLAQKYGFLNMWYVSRPGCVVKGGGVVGRGRGREGGLQNGGRGAGREGKGGTGCRVVGGGWKGTEWWKGRRCGGTRTGTRTGTTSTRVHNQNLHKHEYLYRCTRIPMRYVLQMLINACIGRLRHTTT